MEEKKFFIDSEIVDGVNEAAEVLGEEDTYNYLIAISAAEELTEFSHLIEYNENIEEGIKEQLLNDLTEPSLFELLLEPSGAEFFLTLYEIYANPDTPSASIILGLSMYQPDSIYQLLFDQEPGNRDRFFNVAGELTNFLTR